VEIDPEAVIRCRPVIVTLGGADYRIAARPAVQWLRALLAMGWPDVVPGMLDDAAGDLEALYDRLNDGEVTASECEAAAKDAVTATAGLPWWVAVRLVHISAADPAAIGELQLSGINLETAPLGAVAAALYRIYTRDREAKDVAKFDAALMNDPPGVSAAERFDEDRAAAAFEQMFAARGGR
jgi:hypothetical protein